MSFTITQDKYDESFGPIATTMLWARIVPNIYFIVSTSIALHRLRRRGGLYKRLRSSELRGAARFSSFHFPAPHSTPSGFDIKSPTPRSVHLTSGSRVPNRRCSIQGRNASRAFADFSMTWCGAMITRAKRRLSSFLPSVPVTLPIHQPRCGVTLHDCIVISDCSCGSHSKTSRSPPSNKSSYPNGVSQHYFPAIMCILHMRAPVSVMQRAFFIIILRTFWFSS
jgi:hypothetical protein